MENKNLVQSLNRAFSIIEALGNSGSGLSLASLCAATGLNKSTIHHLLATMKERGYVMQDAAGFYRLTFKICLLSRQLIDGVNMVGMAKPHLQKLCARAQEMVHLVVREGNCVVYLYREEFWDSPAGRIVSNVGLYRAMHTTAAGKSIMATMTDGEIREYWRQADKTKITSATIEELDALLRDVDDARRRGFAIDNEENTPGIRCMAVALKDFTGRAAAAISISGAKSRMTNKRMRELTPQILRTRDEIVASMGDTA